MTNIASSGSSSIKFSSMAPPEPDTTTSRAQAQEGSAASHLSRRDNPSPALQRLYSRRRQEKAAQDSPLIALPPDLQVMIMNRLEKDSMANLRSTCQDLKPVVSKHAQHVTVTNREDLEQAIETYKDGGIEKLTLKSSDITDDDLALLQSLPGLKHLDLSRCYNLTDAGLKHLQPLTSLQHLDLAGCYHLTGAGLAHLQKLTSLQHLGLSECYKLTGASLAHLQTLTSLRHLDLSWCHKLTDADLAHLQTLTSLRHLDLSWCHKLTDAGVNFLRNRIGDGLFLNH